MNKRYQVSGAEGEFEPDSKGLVLRNLVGITSPEDMDALELQLLGLIVIHPFREGNGRLSRLLADVMAVQAGHEPLDYSAWEQHKAAYIGAIHAGFSGDYARMCEFVASAIQAGNASVSERV